MKTAFRFCLRLRRLHSAYDLVKTRLSESEAEAEELNQSQCTFPHFVIGLVLPFVLPTPTIWFSLDHKRNVSDGVASGIRTLFSIDHKLYASDYDYDSDSHSVASENQLYVRSMSRYSATYYKWIIFIKIDVSGPLLGRDTLWFDSCKQPPFHKRPQSGRFNCFFFFNKNSWVTLAIIKRVDEVGCFLR